MAEGFTPNTGNTAERAWMDAVEERLEQMETQQRLFNSSIKGGALVVFDDDGLQVGRIGVGQYSLSDGSLRSAPVTAVSAPNGRFFQLIDSEEGWVVPRWSYNWTPEAQPIGITSSSFSDTWMSHINIVSQVITLSFVVVTDALSTAAVRLELNRLHTTDEIPLDVSLQTTCNFKWDISNLVEIGDDAVLRIQMRRIDGGGQPFVYAPVSNIMQTISRVPDADESGGITTT